MNIAAYCRVSTDKADQLNSLEAQKEFFSEYTKRTGDTLVRLYADEGISGTKIKNRKEFLRMMSDAEHGLFDMVVVKDISRFARNTVDLLQNVRKLKSLGIETQFLTANMTSMGNSEFVLTIFGALAQEESANTSKRVKFGKKMNAEKGRVPNIVYGYDKTIGDYFNLAINKEESKVVQQIYKWYTEEGYGAAKIANMLNEKSPCYMCARMRRGYLYNKAKELGCNKIALGHHFDDVIETTLLSMFYGSEVKTMLPKLHSENYEGLELIRPLYLVKENNILGWVKYNNLKFINCACKFTEKVNGDINLSKRREMKELIKHLRSLNPDIDYNILVIR